MTSRTLFSIVLKVLGILAIKDLIAGIIQVLFSLIDFPFGTNNAVFTFIFSLMVFGVYFAFCYVLIFKTQFIIDKLKLDNNFSEQNLNLKLSKPWILEIALIVTGSVVLFDEIPNLCRYLFKYYEERKTTYGVAHPEISYSVLAFVKILLALLVIGERKRIIRFIDRKDQINPSE